MKFPIEVEFISKSHCELLGMQVLFTSLRTGIIIKEPTIINYQSLSYKLKTRYTNWVDVNDTNYWKRINVIII